MCSMPERVEVIKFFIKEFGGRGGRVQSVIQRKASLADRFGKEWQACKEMEEIQCDTLFHLAPEALHPLLSKTQALRMLFQTGRHTITTIYTETMKEYGFEDEKDATIKLEQLAEAWKHDVHIHVEKSKSHLNLIVHMTALP